MSTTINNKIPITLITGFLGSGKSTFLNYILNENHGKKIAVIQNEFGESIGIETAMIVGGDGSKVSEWLEFPNGCICCTVKDDFLKSIEDLLKKKDRFDYILIESTGMGDPGQISSSLWVDEQLESPVYLDSIVTIVDAKNFEKQLEKASTNQSLSMNNKIITHHSGGDDGKSRTSSEIERQIAFADVILLNKIDLLEDGERGVERIKQKISNINSMATLHQTIRSKVSLDKVLDIKSYIPNADLIQSYLEQKHSSNNNHNHQKKNTSNHSSNINTIFIQTHGYINISEFNRWLGELVWDIKKDEIYRYKGLLSVENEDEKYILQGVYSTFEVLQSGITWQPNEMRINKLVFIGENLDYEKVHSSFIKLLKK